MIVLAVCEVRQLVRDEERELLQRPKNGHKARQMSLKNGRFLRQSVQLL